MVGPVDVHNDPLTVDMFQDHGLGRLYVVALAFVPGLHIIGGTHRSRVTLYPGSLAFKLALRFGGKGL